MIFLLVRLPTGNKLAEKIQNITVINRSKGSGTRGTFEGLILNGKNANSSARTRF